MKPRGIDQLFGVHIGYAGVDVRSDPEGAPAVLAVHALEPGSIGQPEFALLLVRVRGFRARNPDSVDGQPRGHIVGPIAGGLADQVHELAFRPDRIADAHQTLIAQRVDRIEDEILDSRGFLDYGQEMLRMLPRRTLHAGCTEPQGVPAGSDLDHRRAGLEAAGKLAPEREDGPLETPSDLFEGHAPKDHLRRPRDDAERVWPREQPPEDDSRDPVVLADHVAGIRDRRPVLDDRSAQIDLPGPVGRAFQEQFIELLRSVPTEVQQSYYLVPHFAVGHTVPSSPWPLRPG